MALFSILSENNGRKRSVQIRVRNMKISVIGDGGWGSANAILLSGYGHEVTLWGAFPDYIEEMKRTRVIQKILFLSRRLITLGL